MAGSMPHQIPRSRIGRELLNAGAGSYRGIDGSSRMVQAARRTLSETIGEAVLCDIEDLAEPPESFELVLSRMALHYIADLGGTLRACHACLVPGGRLVFTVVHPVITSHDARQSSTEPRQNWIVDDYFIPGPREQQWLGSRTVWHHRTIEDYVTEMRSAGFALINLRECAASLSGYPHLREVLASSLLGISKFLAAGTSVPSHARPNVFCMSRTRDKVLDPNAPWSEIAILPPTSRIAILNQEEAYGSGADARLAVMVSGPEVLLAQARSFAEDFSKIKHESLLGVTDGKAVGTYIETAFKLRLLEGGVIQEDEGNAARGIDLPSLNTDIKVTSIRQPQSSSPFASFRQKIEGLGYDLILFVYDKLDEAGECSVEFRAVRRIPARLTGDFIACG